MKLCYECRVKNGYKRKDDGAHTAKRMKCECCGKCRVVLPERHWEVEI